MLGEIIELPKICDPRGNLTVAEQMKNVPFDIKRVYWTYDDGMGNKKDFHLNHPWQGLLVNTGIWRTLEDFSSGAVCLVLASELYDEADYIYDYSEFLSTAALKQNKKEP